MSLLNCPLEIHHRIISCLHSNRDAAALSLSCRMLHPICDMKTRKNFHQIRVFPNDQSIEQAFGLLMDILKRPILGHYVHEIQHYWRPQCEVKYEMEERKQNLRDLGGNEFHLLESAIQRAGFTGPKESLVLNMIRQRSTSGGRNSPSWCGYSSSSIRGRFIAQALSAILISVSPNLESLALTQPFYSYDRFYMDPEQWPLETHIDYPLDRFLRHANDHPENNTYLQNLRKVYLMVDEAMPFDDERYYNHIDFLGCLALFDKLPSIESVGIDALAEDENHVARINPGSSNVSKLHINHSSLGAPYLARVILSCKHLRDFQYSIGGRVVSGSSFTYFNVKTFTKAICEHRTTLESLDVDVEVTLYDLEYDDDEDIERAIDRILLMDQDEESEMNEFLDSFKGNRGSLKDFVALKRLSLGFRFLLYFAKGVSGISGEEREQGMLSDCLPGSLEYLCIRGYQRHENEKHDAQIDSLVALYESGSSNLKVLVGVEEMIPNAQNVSHKAVDEDVHLLWTLKDAGYEH